MNTRVRHLAEKILLRPCRNHEQAFTIKIEATHYMGTWPDRYRYRPMHSRNARDNTTVGETAAGPSLIYYTTHSKNKEQICRAPLGWQHNTYECYSEPRHSNHDFKVLSDIRDVSLTLIVRCNLRE